MTAKATDATTEGVSKRRAYERTHPWLNFSFDAGRLDRADWLALGKAVSRCEQIAAAPLVPSFARELDRIYLAKGVQATTAIEGNTLTEDEVRKVLDRSLALPPSRRHLGQEVENVAGAWDSLVEELRERGRFPLSVERVEHVNGLVLRDLKLQDHVVPGKVRMVNVRVAAYRCPDWQDAGHLLERLCEVLNGEAGHASGGKAAFAILKAIFAHAYLACIHPFGDGNGRTARFVETAILAEAGLALPACHVLSDHYSRTRDEYYRQLHRISATDDDIYGFVSYALSGLSDGLGEQIEMIQRHHGEMVWDALVDEEFRGKSGASDRRRRLLAREVFRARQGMRVSELPDLSPSLARAYVRVSPRTLARDVSALTERRLLLSGKGGVRANRDIVLRQLRLG